MVSLLILPRWLRSVTDLSPRIGIWTYIGAVTRVDRRDRSTRAAWLLPVLHERIYRFRAISPRVSNTILSTGFMLIQAHSVVAQGTSYLKGRWSYNTPITLQLLFSSMRHGPR
jgi:hypothetical protein